MEYDLNEKEIELLKKACFIPKDSFMCFGKYTGKLYKAGYIDSENNVVFKGRQALQDYFRKYGATE